MTLLSPLALVWLASLPVLVWLWRFSAARRRTVIPSLVPFEHLLRRPPTRRTHLILNLLFWLQAAALSLLALTLAEPILQGRQPRTCLVILDTSASMGALTKGASAMERAKQACLARLSRRAPGERMFVVTTSPTEALTEEPATEGSPEGRGMTETAELERIIRALEPADGSGSLAITRRIAQALLGTRPDDTLVLTDEPEPSSREPGVEFRSFGEPLANVAIVGVDAHEPLCTPTQAQVVVSMQNFSDQEQSVAVSILRDGRALAEQTHTLPPQARLAVSFGLPHETAGLLEIQASAPHDALAVDNRAWVMLRGEASLPVVVASARPAFIQTVGRWLEACPRVSWTSQLLGAVSESTRPPSTTTEQLLITDERDLAQTSPSSAIVFAPQPPTQRPMVARWLTDASHPIGEYLQPLEAASGAVLPPANWGSWGDPVVWGVAEGQKIPLVQTLSSRGRRVVGILLDPTVSGSSVSCVLVFLNSLRWLSGSLGLTTVGEPLRVGPFAPGPVRIQPPRGMERVRLQDGGWLVYEATDQAGRYQFSQGSLTLERIVNVLDPIESNTWARSSTWAAVSSPSSVPAALPPHQSMAPWIITALLMLLLAEWILYVRKGRQR